MRLRLRASVERLDQSGAFKYQVGHRSSSSWSFRAALICNKAMASHREAFFPSSNDSDNLRERNAKLGEGYEKVSSYRDGCGYNTFGRLTS